MLKLATHGAVGHFGRIGIASIARLNFDTSVFYVEIRIF
jgi:hypothetical protein